MPETQALKSARRASLRAAAVVHLEMKRGLTSLATIASTAAWFGLFGTVLGIFQSFGGFGESKSDGLARISESLSEALAPCALGIAVALLALWSYKYLLTKIDTVAQETETESLQLLNLLAHIA